jgi:hypothetical protein
MPPDRGVTWFMAQETRALLTRLARVKSFALHETMVPAAAISPAAQTAIERFLARGRNELRDMAYEYLGWLNQGEGLRVSPAEVQRRFTILRLRFNDVLSQFDTFADVLTQRSEHETGVWLAGLDVAAADALALPAYYTAPPVICYLDRGQGAAIRRARTRLPGGGENPVAIIRVPRERMVGTGIASSLVHEVGHQGSALLDLIPSIRPLLKGLQQGDIRQQMMWRLWERWISEILADFWSVARLGVASTLGLMGVVSLPSAFVFRLNLDDPHPVPWIRVKLSCAIGHALYPHPQWQRLSQMWDSFYPMRDLAGGRRQLLSLLAGGVPSFVALLTQHRPRSLHGHTLGEVFSSADRQPERLLALYQTWRAAPARWTAAPPALAFAVIGQARTAGVVTPEDESRLVANLLTTWALRSALDTSAACATPVISRAAPAASAG